MGRLAERTRGTTSRRRPERPASTPNELRDHRYVLESSSSVVTDTNVGKEWS